VPAIDCVMFADPKQSRIDIVQAAGRALRQYRGKELGYIVVPLVVPAKMDFEAFAETTPFRQVAQTITALSTQDERIADEFRAIEKGRISTGKIVEIDGDVPVGMKMKLDDFAKAISTRIWKNVGRVNWRPFEDARAYVRNLNLKSIYEWRALAKDRSSANTKRLPDDIPTNPDSVYKEAGWIGWSDWLGTRKFASRSLRPFNEAREFVHRLNLKSAADWRQYCARGDRPADIPSHPYLVYSKTGWANWGDWLGTGRVADHLRKFRSFHKARAFVRSLGINSETEWREYCRSGKKPVDIPASPETAYAESGWSGWGDWLGTGRRRVTGLRPFKKAREFVRNLGLKSKAEWREYLKSGEAPNDIPTTPNLMYAKVGWAGWGDWLGGGPIAPRFRKYRSFEKARAYVRGLRLNSQTEWAEYCRSGKKPADIPVNPDRTYAKVGWSGMGDWLGTGVVATFLREYRPFKKARIFARDLGLKSRNEWYEYCSLGKKPPDIPANPNVVYANAGWSTWFDWLGAGRHRGVGWQLFKQARTFVRHLELKSHADWIKYCASGKKPHDIPSAPVSVYAKSGWVGWGDWLGTGRIARPARPLQVASIS
jgi:hypothetical protein